MNTLTGICFLREKEKREQFRGHKVLRVFFRNVSCSPGLCFCHCLVWGHIAGYHTDYPTEHPVKEVSEIGHIRYWLEYSYEWFFHGYVLLRKT